MALLRPLLDAEFVLQAACKLHAQNLQYLHILAGGDKVTDGRTFTPDEWERFHRVHWRVEYYHRPCNVKDDVEIVSMRETISEERLRMLKVMTDYLGEACEPPNDFYDYREWREKLEERYRYDEEQQREFERLFT